MERDVRTIQYELQEKISTHTLTWSVTPEMSSELPLYLNFNSHAHVERDNGFKNKAVELEHFNSHAHVERDEMGLGKISDIKHFNSHAHVERDT